VGGIARSGSRDQVIFVIISDGNFILLASLVPGSCIVLTPCSRVLLENLIVAQLVKTFPAFCGTQRFITVFTKAYELSLSLPMNKDNILTSCFLKIRFKIIHPV